MHYEESFRKRALIALISITACMGMTATSVFADMSATYDNRQITVKGCTITSEEKTILLLNTNDDGSVSTNITSKDIRYINQSDLNETPFKTGIMPAGTYELKIGGDGSVNTATLTVPETVKISGGNGYSSFKDALSKVDNGAEISLAADLDEEIEIPEGKDITINLGGHTIGNKITNNGNLTIKGTGTVKVGITNAGSVTIEGGTYTALPESGTVSIKGGTFNNDVAVADKISGEYAIKSDGNTFTVITEKKSVADPGTYKTPVDESGKYEQMDIFEKENVLGNVTYTITTAAGTAEKTVEYANTDSAAKLGLIITDIPENAEVSVEIQ